MTNSELKITSNEYFLYPFRIVPKAGRSFYSQINEIGHFSLIISNLFEIIY